MKAKGLGQMLKILKNLLSVNCHKLLLYKTSEPHRNLDRESDISICCSESAALVNG